MAQGQVQAEIKQCNDPNCRDTTTNNQHNHFVTVGENGKKAASPGFSSRKVGSFIIQLFIRMTGTQALHVAAKMCITLHESQIPETMNDDDQVISDLETQWQLSTPEGFESMLNEVADAIGQKRIALSDGEKAGFRAAFNRKPTT